MTRSHRVVRLISAHRVAVVVLAAVAVADVAIPAVQSNRPPSLPDLLAGLTLSWCAADLLSAGATRPLGYVMSTAGILWFLPDLAVTGLPAIDHVLAATSLGHVPLVVAAVLMTAGGSIRAPASMVAVVLSTVAAVTAVTGGHRAALPLTGAGLLAAVAAAWRGAGGPTSRSWWGFLGASTAYGLMLLVAPLVRLTGDVEQWAPVVYDVTVCLVAIALASTGTWLRRTSAVDVGPSGLGSVDHLLEWATGLSGARTVAAVPDFGWVDLRGRPVPTEQVVSLDATTRWAVALPSDVAAHPELEPVIDEPMLRQCLRLAAENARLRAESAARLADLADLRQRLVLVEDEERRWLLGRLRTGPLARLDALATDFAGAGLGEDFLSSLARTTSALLATAHGLDPLDRPGSLDRAIGELVADRPTRTSASVECVEVDASVGRTIWYACAEALTNATKHAPGSSVTVDLHAEDGAAVLTVADDGAGGADERGSGLRGIRDRVTSIGGALTIQSDGAGTVVTVRMPLGSTTSNHVLESGDDADVPLPITFLASSTPTRTEEP